MPLHLHKPSYLFNLYFSGTLEEWNFLPMLSWSLITNWAFMPRGNACNLSELALTYERQAMDREATGFTCTWHKGVDLCQLGHGFVNLGKVNLGVASLSSAFSSRPSSLLAPHWFSSVNSAVVLGGHRNTMNTASLTDHSPTTAPSSLTTYRLPFPTTYRPYANHIPTAFTYPQERWEGASRSKLSKLMML